MSQQATPPQRPTIRHRGTAGSLNTLGASSRFRSQHGLDLTRALTHECLRRGPPDGTRTTRSPAIRQTTTSDLQVQEDTHFSCIRDRPPQLGPLLKLDEKALVCKNRSEHSLHDDGGSMTSQTVARRRPAAGRTPEDVRQVCTAEEAARVPGAHEVEAVIRATDNPRAKLLMLEQWRAGLRIAEALALEVSDLSLDAEPPTLRVRAGKGNRSRGTDAP